MRIPVLVSGPAAAVTAAEARAAKVFSADDADSYVDMLLAVAQSHIDGIHGTLGRSIGLQTLELTLPSGCKIDSSCLPFPPYVDTVSDEPSEDGATHAFRWRAGYGADPATALPAALRHAIIMMAGVLRDAVPADEGALKSKTVDGVGRWDYSLPDGAAASMQKAADSLLAQFRVLSL
ncbi:hypothetical protein FNL55_12665 [Tardiphaga sp. vice352]|uniref:hypothetical protein n=1 Tax=Tardiphaga sp. vice352 TaxID=2592816 RepID=UPI0011629517|nr:hypothetical protein [Tardiphaga sp. vice352]QDM32091.1 hypothetical protein FNL55_12665 [Tardiphaga sp. vice352]